MIGALTAAVAFGVIIGAAFRKTEPCRRACCVSEGRRARWMAGEDPETPAPRMMLRDDRKPRPWRPGLTGPC